MSLALKQLPISMELTSSRARLSKNTSSRSLLSAFPLWPMRRHQLRISQALASPEQPDMGILTTRQRQRSDSAFTQGTILVSAAIGSYFYNIS